MLRTHSVKEDKKRKRAILIKTNSIILRLVVQQHTPKHVEKYQGIKEFMYLTPEWNTIKIHVLLSLLFEGWGGGGGGGGGGNW